MRLLIPVSDESEVCSMVLELRRPLANYLLDLHAHLKLAPAAPPGVCPGNVRVRVPGLSLVRLLDDNATTDMYDDMWSQSVRELTPEQEPERCQLNNWIDDSLTQLILVTSLTGGDPAFVGLGIVVVLEDEGCVYSDDVPWTFVMKAAGVRL